MGRFLTFSDLDLGTRITLGHILHASHNLGHDGRLRGWVASVTWAEREWRGFKGNSTVRNGVAVATKMFEIEASEAFLNSRSNVVDRLKSPVHRPGASAASEVELGCGGLALRWGTTA